MTLLPDSQVNLPPVVERLLLDVVADGFTVYCCGPRAAPTVLAASYEWEDCVDHLTIRHWDQVTAARLPKPKLGRVDVFAPEVVVWAYQGPAECTLRALLTLVHPQHPDAPTGIHPAPRSLHVPRHHQRPMSIRLPSASRAGARTARMITVWAGSAAVSAADPAQMVITGCCPPPAPAIDLTGDQP